MKPKAATLEESIKPILIDALISLKPVTLTATRQRAIKSGIMNRVVEAKKLSAASPALAPIVVCNALNAADANWIRVNSRIDCQVLFDDGKSSAQLVRFAAGGVSLGHRHDADEAAVVVKGWCMVGDMRLDVGDYHMVPAGASHEDIVSPDGCVLFLHGPSYRHQKYSVAATSRA